MPISDRIEGSIEKWAAKWSVRLGTWAGQFIGAGLDGFTRMMNKGMSKQLVGFISKLESTPDLPEELKPILQEMKAPTGEGALGFLGSAANRVASGAFGKIIDAMFLKFSYQINRMMPNVILGPEEIIAMNWRRGVIDEETIKLLANHGLDPDWAKALIELKEMRFPSDIVNELWHRDKVKYHNYERDLTAIGITPDRQQALWELSWKIPGVQDIIRYVVKEAYNSEIYKAFGQDQEYPAIAEADAEKAGVRPDMLMKEWIAHWDLPSVGNGFEMLHRGQITQEQLSLLLKARDIMPFWRDKLTAISWLLPGRIEVRMMAMYGLVTKEDIVELLKQDGLEEKWRSRVADMNIVRGVRSDIQTRYIKKWIDSDGVRKEIDALHLDPPMPEKLYQWIVTNAKPERTSAQKDLTVAQIVKAVKLGLVPWEDGIQRLLVLGYDEDEADLVMMESVEVVEEEPTTELNVRVDTIRRQRRQRVITRDQEIASLVGLGLDRGLATAYADNDDLRLVKETAGGA